MLDQWDYLLYGVRPKSFLLQFYFQQWAEADVCGKV